MTNVALSMAVSLYTKQIDMILNQSHQDHSESSKAVNNVFTQSSDTTSDDDTTTTTMESPLLINNEPDEVPKPKDQNVFLIKKF